MKKTLIAIAILLGGLALAQDKPEPIAKKDLPKNAVATFCTPDGKTEMERPSIGYLYKGKAYYFCGEATINAFLKDPEGFLPPILPRPTPAFDLKDLSGKTWNDAAMIGKLVLVDFWATWCGPCKAMMPMLDKLHARYKGKGFEILSVSIDEKKPDLDKFLQGHKFPNPVIHDDQKTWQKWGVKNIPAMFLIKDGTIIAQWSGKQTEKTLEAAISANLPK